MNSIPADHYPFEPERDASPTERASVYDAQLPSLESPDANLALRRGIGGVLVAGQQESQTMDRQMLPSVEQVPSLFERGIKGPDSLHGHKYDRIITVRSSLIEAEDLPAAERTESQATIVADTDRLQEYTYASDYMDVFTPDELHDLVAKLELLRNRDRTDFKPVESMLVDMVLRYKKLVPDASVRGIAQRAERNDSDRAGMRWETMNKLAIAANTVITGRMFAGDERTRYIVPIRYDPDHRNGNDPESLKDVYQFVAASHGLDMYGKRSTQVYDSRLQTYRDNCAVIDKWYEEARSGILQLPDGRGYVDSLYANQPGYRDGTARVNIQIMLDKLVGTMHQRLEGTERFGKNKSYTKDPAGAIRLQLLIAHTIERVRENLGAGIHPSDLEIVPFENLDDI